MKLLLQSVMILLVFTVLTGLIYPLFITGIAQVCFNRQANGSLIYKGKEIVASELIGVSVTNDRYFYFRPSASGYDGTNSGTALTITVPRVQTL